MPISVKLVKMLHRKSAEFLNPLAAGNTVAGGFIVSDKSDMIAGHDTAYYVGGASAIWNYNADNDAWMQIPNSGITGTFGAGACGEFRAISAPGGVQTLTATGGSTSTINTNLTLTRSLSGCEIRVVDGAGVGYKGIIASNTCGTNSIITLTTPNGVAFNNTTKYQYFAGTLWFFNGGAGTVGFSVYDRSTNAWTARSVANIATTFGTEGQLVSTSGRCSNRGAGFVNGTATSGTATTLVDSTKAWPSGGWVNFQVRIVSGTGAGQIRAITANNGTSLTVATWTVNPDATSVYCIEGNDDHIYLMGNAAVTLYRFSISGNAWSALSPVSARATAPGAGCTFDWIDSVQTPDWLNGLYATHYGAILKQNGRYIYSFRGGASNALDVYDIAGNTWISNVVYGQQMETFTTGTCSVDLDGLIYIQKEATGRIYRFDVGKHSLEPFTLNPIPQGAVLGGHKMFMSTLLDGSRINYLFTLSHTRPELIRWLVI
jgi:hypothetical protein